MTIKKTTKLYALGGATILAAIALPVMANQNALPLRGAWNAMQYAAPSAATVPTRQHYMQQQQAQSPCLGQQWVQPACAKLQQPQMQHQPQYQHQTQYAPQQGDAQNQAYAPNPHNAYEMRPVANMAQAPRKPFSFFGLRGRSDARAQMPVQYASRTAPVQGQSRYNMGSLAVRTSAAHSNRMLDWQENTTGKAITLLQHRRNGILAPNSLYLGGGMKGGLMWQRTDEPGKFPILSRFPFFSNRTDDQTGVFAINNAALAITGTFGDWTTIYLQPEYSETDFPRAQDEMQLRKAFVTFGNLDKSPFYAAFGRKTIDFGNFNGYNPFTQTESQHYFWAQSDQPVLELGYYKNGLKMSATAFSAGRQLRTAYAGEENNIGNYAASIEKEFLLGNSGALTFGTSYLHDTIYRNNWTAHTFNAIMTGTPPANFIEYRNSAVSAFAEYNSDVLDLMLEYTTTLEPWAAAIPQAADGTIAPAYIDANGNIDFDENLSVTVAQARYKPRFLGGNTAFSAVGTWGNVSDEDYRGVGIGGATTSFGKNQQHVLGVEHSLGPYLDFGAEYVYNKGFIPFVAPQLVSDQSVDAHAINVGFKARF
ncbi:MAG: LbtU family siderophore porin [Robiginitomaculum sp.]